jgi:hypothetical protein
MAGEESSRERGRSLLSDSFPLLNTLNFKYYYKPV